MLYKFHVEDAGFEFPSGPPPSMVSSTDVSPGGRRACSCCSGRMSILSSGNCTVCVSCRGRGCDVDIHYEECVVWTDEDVLVFLNERYLCIQYLSLRLLLLLRPSSALLVGRSVGLRASGSVVS